MSQESKGLTSALAKILPAKINRYGEIDQEIKAREPEKKELNQEIKEAMVLLGMEEMETDFFTASYSVQNRTTMNSDAILRLLKEAGQTDLIIKVEVPDIKQIEDLIYKGDTELAALVAPAIDVKPVEVLSVKPKKGKK